MAGGKYPQIRVTENLAILERIDFQKLQVLLANYLAVLMASFT